MVLIPTVEDFPAASGLINMPHLNAVYETIMDEVFLDNQGRYITVHLPPERTADTTTQSLPQASQYNAFFGRVAIPRSNTRNAGVRITPRDMRFTALIKVGPIKEGDDTMGIGDLKANEAVVTVDISALPYIQEARSISVEGRRYQVTSDRPIGFTRRSYLMVFLEEINEKSVDTRENMG